MRVLICETSWTTVALSHNLRDAGFLMTRAESEEDFDTYLSHGRQDIMVLPLDLGDPASLRRLESLRHQSLGKPILVLSGSKEPSERAAALEAGADDILPETGDPSLLIARIKALVLRSRQFASAEVPAGPAVIDVMTRKVRVGQTPVRLSPLEYEIFEALALRQGKPMSQDRLMDQLYAWEDEPDAKIIRVYLSKIRRKLVAAGAPDGMIETRWGHGYNIAGEDQDIAA